MKTREDVFKKLKKYPDSITITPGLEKPAVQLAEKLYGQPSGGKHTKKTLKINWKILTSACACLLVVACIMVFFSGTPSVVEKEQYYVSTDVEASAVDDIPLFLEENERNCKYYTSGYLYTTANAYYLIEESNRLVYLIQDSLFISESGVDMLSLGIVFEKGQFQQFDDFVDLGNCITVSDLEVKYSINTGTDVNTILSSFLYEGVEYFLEIQSCGEEEILEFYVTQLFS